MVKRRDGRSGRLWTMTFTAAGLDRLQQATRQRIDKGELPGAVMLVADGDDEFVAAQGFTTFGGAAGGGAPMRRDTPFRLASMTKPMLAAVAMMLVDDGTLNLTAPVERWLPELAGRRVLSRIDGPLDDTVPADRSITVDDLLTFRLGHGLIVEPEFNPPDYPIIRAANELELRLAEPDPRTPYEPDEWLRRFATLPLMDQPGVRWRYNTGSLILGVLVARASGRRLEDVLAERLFTPLGMADTGFWRPAGQAERLPGYYMTDIATGQMTEQLVTGPDVWSKPPVFASGAAGLVSTVDDVARFARLMHDRGAGLLSAHSYAMMTTNVLTPAQIAGGGFVLAGRGWGYGMSVAVTPDEVSATPGRYGWEGGYGTLWFNDPATGRIVILLTQVSDALFNGTFTELGRLALAA
jgi:CubicO group peptidase (beta-lactamase class C family)